MKRRHESRILLSQALTTASDPLELFAILNLGLVQSLHSGALTATDAVRRFYHAENCQYVRRRLRNRGASAIMSHGVQLPDLFECLRAEEAQAEFRAELEAIRALSLRLLDKTRASRGSRRAAA